MEKRALLAGGLSLLVFIVFQLLFAPNNKMQTTPPPILDEPARQVSSGVKESSDIKTDLPPVQRRAVSAPLAPQATERTVTVNTGVSIVKLSDRFASIAELSLLDYKDQKGNMLNLLKREPLENLPLGVSYGDSALKRILARAHYSFLTEPGGDIDLSPERPEERIAFTFVDETGVKVTKEYTFSYNEYLIGFSVTIEDPVRMFTGMPASVFWGGGVSSDIDDARAYKGPTVLDGGKLFSDLPGEEGEENLYVNDPSWVATQNKYFMASLLPVSEMLHKGYVRNTGDDLAEVGYRFKVDDGVSVRFDLYAGPKKAAILKKYNVNLERIINFGWFDVLGKPLFTALIWLYGFTHNFGIAIILLTVCIKLIFFPLSQKSFVSMKKMQKVQPQMKILNERYKKDRTKLNEEMMKLYKKHKVNPLGGCLPTVVQIPVFIALYQVLLNAIELRGAPFFLWITDLAQKDPYYVTPLIMGATMFIQQKMTPTTVADPTQQKIMMFLPVIFTVMFLNFPSGLVLYWIVNNLLTIGQQYLIHRSSNV